MALLEIAAAKSRIALSDSKNNSLTKSRKAKTSKKRKLIPISSPQSSSLNSEVDNPVINDTSPTNSCKSSTSTEVFDIRPPKKQKALQNEIEVDITAPEPPSKKALRKLKKSKLLHLPKSSIKSVFETEVETKKKTLENDSDHGVWMGNLSYHINKEQIQKFLVDNSEISDEMITRINLPGLKDNKLREKTRNTQLNKGFAYVDFSNAEAISQAVNLSEKLLNGRRVLIKDNKSFEGRPPDLTKTLGKDKNPVNKRIFIGNLSYDSTEEILKEQFEKCGPIKELKVATFEDTGKCKGYAWIIFEELEGAESAVRGFIKLTQAVSGTLNNTSATEESSFKKVSNQPESKKLEKKIWINKLHGRNLRVEFAEDAQLRYKKRYGKVNPNKAGELKENDKYPASKVDTKPLKKIEYRQPYAPRLTGGIVESEGKKITF